MYFNDSTNMELFNPKAEHLSPYLNRSEGYLFNLHNSRISVLAVANSEVEILELLGHEWELTTIEIIK